MYEGHMDTVELIWPNIGAFVIGFSHKTAGIRHKLDGTINC